LVYDVSVRESFESLESWICEATKFGANLRNIPIVLCANKVDKRRLVSEEEGRQYAASKNFTYFETSASSGGNVQEAFEYIFRSVLRSISANV
jgi:GTPase SAR1 family protein